MVFSSITFLVYFLPIFLIVYHFCRKEYKNLVILLASILFYAWGAPTFIFILLASTWIDFYLVGYMHKCQESVKKKRLLILSILLNVGLLCYFKYANFFVENVNGLLTWIGLDALSWTEVALPIGISFYTFQTLTYSIDVYRGIHEPLKRARDYLLYIIMFPQMIAGPIVRFSSVANDIVHREDRYEDKVVGFTRFCIGLGKKVLIANVLGAKADEIMSLQVDDLSSPMAWVGILAYTFQIYFDFSGYSDMAIGLGRMMGFRFPENFDNPYTSRSITEFWQRWHMTLGTWMRDYLYIPLGGNRLSAGRTYFNLCFVFFVSGLWHGASWNFVLWGIFHGFFLVIERLFLGRWLRKVPLAIGLFYAFFVTILGWVIFRIENIAQAGSYYSRLFAWRDAGAVLKFDQEFYWVMLLAVLFSFFRLFPYGQKIQTAIFEGQMKSYAFVAFFMVCLFMFFLSIGAVAVSSFNPFIYFRF